MSGKVRRSTLRLWVEIRFSMRWITRYPRLAPARRCRYLCFLCQDLKNILNKRKAGFVKGTDRMILNGLADLFQQFFFNGGKHIENIRIMEIESRTVDIHFLYQFFYSNFFNTFFLHSFASPARSWAFVLRILRSVFSFIDFPFEI